MQEDDVAILNPKHNLLIGQLLLHPDEMENNTRPNSTRIGETLRCGQQLRYLEVNYSW